MPKWSGKIGRWIVRLITEDDLDLWLLAAAAAAFTVLGITDVASQAILSSAVLALLALLATAQIRSRREIASIAAAQRRDPTSLLSDVFPDDLSSRREEARDVLMIGMALSRTVQAYREPLQRSLTTGARVRAMVLDPDVHDLMSRRWAALGHSVTPGGRRRIENSLAELIDIQNSTGGALEIRVAPFWPTIGVNALDTDSQHGMIVVQHYEFEARGEPAAIMKLGVDDGRWYRHYVAEAERMWAVGIPWPLSPEKRLAGLTGPAFVESLGDAPIEAISTAEEVLITGVARNTLLMANYHVFEAALARGTRIHVVLLDPDSSAVDVAADRYYAERSPDTLRARIRHTHRLISTLAEATGGDIQLRFTKHPIATGAIAVATAGAGGGELLFLEYYTHQAPGEPKFLLRPSDGPAYRSFLGEAEILWRDAAAPAS